MPDFYAGAPQAGVARELLFERRGDRVEEGDTLYEIELRGSGGEEVCEMPGSVAAAEHTGVVLVDFGVGNGRVLFDAVDCGEEGVLIEFAVG